MSAAGRRRSRGFTLVELLVVLAILALVSGIVFPAIETMAHSQAFLAASLRIDGALHACRSAALRSGTIVRFGATRDRHGFRAAGAVEQLPGNMVIAVPRGGIAFFSDGSAIGGSVTLADAARIRRWTIGAVNGAIERPGIVSP